MANRHFCDHAGAPYSFCLLTISAYMLQYDATCSSVCVSHRLCTHGGSYLAKNDHRRQVVVVSNYVQEVGDCLTTHVSWEGVVPMEIP